MHENIHVKLDKAPITVQVLLYISSGSSLILCFCDAESFHFQPKDGKIHLIFPSVFCLKEQNSMLHMCLVKKWTY